MVIAFFERRTGGYCFVFLPFKPHYCSIPYRISSELGSSTLTDGILGNKPSDFIGNKFSKQINWAIQSDETPPAA